MDERRLLDLLAQVRTQGYAASYGNVTSGSGAIATVLLAEQLERSGAKIVERMRTAIAHILGFP